MRYTKKQTTLFAILVLLIFVILVSFFMVRFKGKSSQFSQEVIETLMAENEDNPESVKYLVTDNCISRVYPETKIETFVTNFSEGEVVKVYSDKACTQEVTDGFVMSGMYAKYDENDRIFEISVLGDINEKTSKAEENKVLNGDGILNQIELTRDIREAIDDEDWKIVDETEKKSADVNCNGEIDEKSVNTIIDYIVFGNLNIEEVPLVKKPTIEVVEGVVNANTVYTSDVVLQIHVNEEDCLKTVYKITGDKNQDYKTAIDGEKVVLDKDGVYKITAYTYGQLENKSKREYVIICLDKTANYTMEYYLENEKGEYEKAEEDTKVVEGIIGTKVEIDDKLYTDYELDVDNELANLNGEVLEDGSLVLKAYYERKSFSYTFIAGNNIEEISVKKKEIDEIENDNSTSETDEEIESEEIQEANTTEKIDSEKIDSEETQKSNTEVTITSKWGTTLTIDAKVRQEDGYKIEWNNWKNINNDDEILTEQKTSLIMQNENRTYEATATKEVIDYSIVYNLQEGKLVEGITNPEKYNIETLTFTLNNPSRQGYIFQGWTGGVVGEDGEIDNTLKTGTTPNVTNPTTTLTIETGSIGNRKYTANWKAMENTPYKVEYYKETLKTGEFVLAESENKEGTTDTEATAEIKDYTGFTFDAQNENNILNGQIKADGSLVLKVYYTRNIYNLTITAGNNIASVSAEGENCTYAESENSGIGAQQLEQSVSQGKQTTEDTITLKYKYQQNVTIEAILENLVGYNYTWTGWNSSNTTLIPNQTEQVTTITMPAGNIELTAEATKREKDFNYSIEYYYDNVIDNEKTITKAEKYNTQITTYEEKLVMGYEFDKVEGTPLTISENEETNKIKVYYTAINYNIVYDLQGGAIDETDTTEGESTNTNQETVNNEQTIQKTNPTTYTINTEDFTLINPTKKSHNFLGWTGGVVNNDGNIIDNPTNEITGTTGNTITETTTLTIEKGSIGNRKYTANWQQIEYEVIVHHYLQETGPEFGKEPIRVCDDEVLISKVLGAEYTTSDIIQKYDDEGNPIIEGDRKYLDPEEISVVGNTGNMAGTYTEETIEVIYYYKYYPAVRIVSSPAEELNGTEYVTIKDAIEALESKGLTSQSEISKLEILRNVKNESVVIENKNVQINLAGFTVNSKSETEPTIKLDNSKLIVTDESALELGKIVSENSSGIYVKTNSEFTLGVEAKPVKQTPEIIGDTIGVEKEIIDDNQGIFNFFDGTITGEIAILGKVDLTPVVYNATVTTNENTDQVAKLAIVSGIEARIGRKLYTKLEDAINDANTVIGTDGSQVEIVVVTDLAKSQKVVIDKTKNIKLDIEGHTITNTVSDYVFENRGNLEIIDSTADDDNPSGTGKIVSTTYSTILNSYTTDEVLVEKYTADDLITPGTYGFKDDEGKLVSTNTLKSGSVANSYVKLDLSELEGEYLIIVNAEISSESNYDYGYATITQNTTVPEYNNSTGRIMYISGDVEAKDYTQILYGGNTYYLHLGYRKDGSKDTGKDTLTINNITLIINKTDPGNLTLTSGIISIEKEGSSSSYKNAIYNLGNVTLDGAKIQGNKNYINGILNGNNGIAYINSGIISGSSDAIKFDAIKLADKSTLVINGGNISGYNGIINNSTAPIAIETTGGTVVGRSGNAIKNNVTSRINLVNLEISSKGSEYAVYNYSNNGQIYIENCTITSSYGISNASYDFSTKPSTYSLQLKNTTINSTNTAVRFSNSDNANFSITGGSITGNISSYYSAMANVDINDTTIVGNIDSRDSLNLVLNNCDVTGQIENYFNSSIKINGGKISNTTGSIIINAESSGGTVTIDNNAIINASNGNPIYNYSNGTVNIYSGTLNSANTHWGIYSEGSINLGKNDGEININTPVINAVNGVKNLTGTFNFYDGIINSNIGKTIQGKVTNIPEGTEVIITTTDGKDTAIVGIPTIPEAQIGETTYTTLTEAIEAVPEGTDNVTTIKLLRNINPVRTFTISENKNIKINLNNYEIKSLINGYVFDNNGILELTTDISDTTSTKPIILVYARNNVIKNTNKLIINGCKINTYEKYISVIKNTGNMELINTEITTNSQTNVKSIENIDNGSIIINDGTKISNINENKWNYYTYGIYSNSSGDIVMNGGAINSTEGIYNLGTGNVTINGGTIDSKYNCIYNENSNAVITINDGDLDALDTGIIIENGKLIINGGSVYEGRDLYGIKLKNSSLLEMYGGSVTGWRAIWVETSDVNVKIFGGTITGRQYIGIRNIGTLEVSGGTISSNLSATDSSGIYNSDGGIVKITNGTITGQIGIENNGTLTITGGEIKGTSKYGIKSSTGTLTIGEKGGEPSKITPYIYGKTYGISNGGGTFNFYDGKIEGTSNQSISGTVTEIEEGYEIIKTIENSRETAVLDMLPIAENVSTGNKYFTLQEAFDDCSDGTEEEVKVLRNVIIISDVETATINSNKNIVLDLNGFEISAGNKNTILNKGKLTIKDGTTSQSGKLKNTAQELILLEESGELIFESGNLQETVNKNLITNNGTGNITINGGNIITYNSSAIINNRTDSGAGNITINGGTIKSLDGGSTGKGNCIYLNSGSITVNDGSTIVTKGSAIYINGENCDVTVNGGTIGTSGNGVYNNAGCENVKVIAGTLGKIVNNATGKIVIGLPDDESSIPRTDMILNNSTGEIIIENIHIEFSNKYDCVTNIGGGTVNINNGYMKTPSTPIINEFGTINISGGTIIAYDVFYDDYEIAIINNASKGESILNISGGTISSDKGNAIKNGRNTYSNSAKLNITGGNISSSNGTGIESYTNGIINVGIDDGIIDNDSIIIKGKTYGIASHAQLNYFDGTIQGAINKSIYGRISKLPENTEITYQKDSVEIATLGSENVAKIGDTSYNSLNDAINSCSDSSSESTTITLMKDIGIGGSNYKIISGQNIVLDLNGKRINQYCAISNSGNFEITDNTEEKLGVIDVSDRMINNNGVFRFSAGKIYSYMFNSQGQYTTDSIGSRIIINNYENGSVEMTGGYLYNYMHGTGTSKIIYTSSTNNISLSGGTIEMSGYCYTGMRYQYGVHYVNTDTENSGNIILDGTNINNTSSQSYSYSTIYALYINNNTNVNVEINSGTLNTEYAIYRPDDGSKYGTLAITGGDIPSKIQIDDLDSMEISGGDITSSVSIYNANNIEIAGGTISGNIDISTSKLTINDGTITGNLNVSNGHRLSGSLTTTQINGGTISGNATFSSANIATINGGTLGNVTFSSSNTTTINGGNITGTLTISAGKVTMLGGTINNQSGNGVNLSGGTFTLGIKDYPVDITLPSITSSAIGVNRTGGTFNFYDGIITGQTKAISGEVADMPELYTVQLDEEAKVATLGINATFEQVVSIDGTYYNSIHEAVRAAGTANTIIKLEKDNVLSNTLTIAENQNITLDLASYSIRIPDEEYCVVNNGNLTIIDTVYTDVSSDEVSGIENYTGVAIQNNGTLVLGIEDEIVHTKVPSIIGKTYGIENNGTLSIFDGTVKGETDAIGGTQTIINIPDGYSYKVELEVVDDTTNRKVFVLCTSEDAS